jgi:hypothetical protein
MEFIKIGKNYMIKNSNGRIVSEKEKLELENKELVIKDITGCECQKETTKKIAKNKKRIKEIDNEYEELLKKKKVELFNKDLEKITALQDKENADGTIEETISTD